MELTINEAFKTLKKKLNNEKRYEILNYIFNNKDCLPEYLKDYQRKLLKSNFVSHEDKIKLLYSRPNDTILCKFYLQQCFKNNHINNKYWEEIFYYLLNERPSSMSIFHLYIACRDGNMDEKYKKILYENCGKKISDELDHAEKFKFYLLFINHLNKDDKFIFEYRLKNKKYNQNTIDIFVRDYLRTRHIESYEKFLPLYIMYKLI